MQSKLYKYSLSVTFVVTKQGSWMLHLLLIMKAVSIILALAIISGCQARILPHDDITWEITVDQIKEYIGEVNTQAEETLAKLSNCKLTRDLDALTKDTIAELFMYKDDLETKLAPYAQETTERLVEDLQLLANKLQVHLIEAGNRAHEYSQEFKSMVAQNADDIKSKVNTYGRKLHKRLNKDQQEISRTVTTFFEELQARTTENIDSVRERVEPYITEVHERTEEKISKLNRLLMTNTEEVREKLKSTVEKIRESLEKTTETLHTNLEDKVEDLHKLLETFAAIIHDKVNVL